MRTIGALGLAVSLLGAAIPARAQQDTVPHEIAEARLPGELAERVTSFFNNPRTIHFNGRTRIPADGKVSGDVAVMDGPMEVAGRIDGDLIVINGDLVLVPGAVVGGSVIVVGGEISGADSARVAGEITSYSAPLEFARSGERIVLREPGEPADSLGDETVLHRRPRGRARLVLASEGSYNRVEGLPITFGPVVETPGSNPFRLRARAIFRTEAEGPYRAERWGGEVQAEQFLGGNRLLRVGGAVRSLVSPIEGWHLTNVENSLSTFVFHRDLRDYYQRRGYSVFATVAPRFSPFSGTLEFRSERHLPLAAGDPWSIFNEGEGWRLQPYAARGDLSSLVGSIQWDSRNDPDDPSSGWYFETELERAVRSTLVQPEFLATSIFRDNVGDVVVSGERPFGLFTHGMIDLRRYNRISPTSRLNLRVMAAGALGATPLAPQRQHALGGEGSLPGFNLLSMDCGARGQVVRSQLDPHSDPAPRAFFRGYGCDRVVLVQAEYRGNVDFRINFGRSDDGEEDEGFGREVGNVLNGTLGWIFFADAGSGWAKADPGPVQQDGMDVGAGVLLGRLGVYAAVPVASDGRFVRPSRGPNIFVRLNSRF